MSVEMSIYERFFALIVCSDRKKSPVLQVAGGDENVLPQH